MGVNRKSQSYGRATIMCLSSQSSRCMFSVGNTQMALCGRGEAKDEAK